GLKPYRVLYVTEPDIPVEGQRGIAAWVQGGGTLVSGAGAGSGDRYDQPCPVLGDLSGVQETLPSKPAESARARVKPVVPQSGTSSGFTASGARATLARWKGTVLAAFDDGSPAVLRSVAGEGRIFHFTWLPGRSYAEPLDRLGPTGVPTTGF